MDPASILDLVKRHGALLAVLGLALWWLDRWAPTTLKAIAVGAATSAAAVLTAGLAVWAFTRLDLVREKRTDVIARVFLGIAIIYGLTLLGNLAVLVAPVAP